MALDFPSSPALNDTYTDSGRTWRWNGSGWQLVTDPPDNSITTAMLQDDAVTYAKIQNVSTTDKLLGRSSAGAGNVEEITCTAAGRALLDDADAAAQRTTLGLGTLATQSGTFSGTSSGTNTGDQTITLTGDVTGSGTGSFAATIANSAVTNAKVASNAAIDGSKIQAASTTNAGAVQLTDSTSSTSTTTAATPNAVKSAYDLADAALPKAGGALTGDITLNAQADLRFADSDSSNWVALQAPATVASNVTWTLPDADGTSGQSLQTNGSGNLSWANTPTTNIRYLTSGTSATYTPTSGTRSFFVEVIGGGGGGGGVAGLDGAGNNAASTGGGGGGYAAILITNMSQTFTYTVGAGGTSTAGNNNGTAGGTSSFVGSTTGTISATGGAGGDGDIHAASRPRKIPAVAGGSGSGGTVNYRGSYSTAAVIQDSSTNGIVPSFSGAAPTIGGGSTKSSIGAGIDGINYGEGGSGALVNVSTTNYAGGDGAGGVIRITEFF